MKILQINTVCGYGSTGTIAVDIAKKIESKGSECFIAYGGRSSNYSKSIHIGSNLESKIHALFFTRFLGLEGFGSLIATIKLISWIKKNKPNIIVLHNLHGHYLNYPILFRFLVKSKISVVWILHDCWSYTGHCVHYSMEHCFKWEKKCEKCPLKKSYPQSYFFDTSYITYKIKKRLFNKVVDLTIIPVSYWLGDEVRKSFLSSHRIEVIHNGVDLNIFSPQRVDNVINQYHLNKKRILLGVASPWSIKKGFNDFIRLRGLLSDEYAIVLVGVSEQQMKLLPKGITGIMRTSNVNGLAQLYSAAMAFLNLTYEDNYPTTNMEAISCGTPVITYNTGGSIESVTSQTGRVVDQGNLQSVVDAVISIRNEDQNQIMKACRQYAEKHFDKNECYQKHVDLYQNIIKNNVSI